PRGAEGSVDEQGGSGDRGRAVVQVEVDDPGRFAGPDGEAVADPPEDSVCVLAAGEPVVVVDRGLEPQERARPGRRESRTILGIDQAEWDSELDDVSTRDVVGADRPVIDRKIRGGGKFVSEGVGDELEALAAAVEADSRAEVIGGSVAVDE